MDCQDDDRNCVFSYVFIWEDIDNGFKKNLLYHKSVVILAYFPNETAIFWMISIFGTLNALTAKWTVML